MSYDAKQRTEKLPIEPEDKTRKDMLRVRDVTEAKKDVSISEKCFICGRTDEEAPIFPVKFRGEDKWVCAKCLPRLIHG